mmetsp:Transcript_69343/g.162324  ORF Transcript_69343/g.162324 Transcript_69343/m.162324 type:complete len:84 (+) Transcript_69343:1880-2131(+)
MLMSEEAAGQLVFCWSCGNNFHADCIRRWQQACSDGSSRPCPLCRQPRPWERVLVLSSASADPCSGQACATRWSNIGRFEAKL